MNISSSTTRCALVNKVHSFADICKRRSKEVVSCGDYQMLDPMSTIQRRRNQSFIWFIESNDSTNTQLLQTRNVPAEWNRTQQKMLQDMTLKDQNNQKSLRRATTQTAFRVPTNSQSQIIINQIRCLMKLSNWVETIFR
uniref:Protein-tyrosine phosphatase mitochondrial 1 n=1 Tax=Rhizophora mucronata TaxID=61149 RepID=A0A2P2JPX1_RHIMU